MSVISKPSFKSLYHPLKQLTTKDLQMVILMAHLQIKARKKKTTNYITPAAAMGMFSAGLGPHLEELFQMNIEEGDPLYGSLIVNKSTEMPSDGFFNAAVRCELATFTSEEDKKKFWLEQMARVYAASASEGIKELYENLTDEQRREMAALIRVNQGQN
jgi:hypothetical protein